MAAPDAAALAAVELALRTADPEGNRLARTLRRIYDQIYDGRNTGRYSWEQLQKTEKTHFGSMIEINLQREFRTEFEDGIHLDYRVAGFEVDCKWSRMDGKKDGEFDTAAWLNTKAAVSWIKAGTSATSAEATNGSTHLSATITHCAGAITHMSVCSTRVPDHATRLPDCSTHVSGRSTHRFALVCSGRSIF